MKNVDLFRMIMNASTTKTRGFKEEVESRFIE